MGFAFQGHVKWSLYATAVAGAAVMGAASVLASVATVAAAAAGAGVDSAA